MSSTASRGRRLAPRLEPLVGVGPAVALIAVVVLWPVVVMFRASFQHFTPNGCVLGSRGVGNYSDLWAEPDLTGVLTRTVGWVVGVVVVTMFLSLGLEQMFNQRFPGGRLARWAL